MKKALLSFRNFSFRYDSQAEDTLKAINLDVHDGEVLLIAGPSGSGKSTLGQCINGLIPNAYKGTTKGSLLIDGQDAGEQSIFERSRLVGTVLQDSDAQFIGLTVGEDIAFTMENEAVPQWKMKKRVAEAAERVDMVDYLQRSPHDLSGGQKQRVSFAGVLVNPVRVLLFDEPLANLDPATGKQTMQLIQRIHQETGVTVIIIEHRIEDVLEIAVNRIVVLKDGQIIADQRPAELLCTDLMAQCGLREPLYLSAAKKAGVKVTPAMHPENVTTFADDGMAQALFGWASGAVQRERTDSHEPLITLDHLRFGYTKEQPLFQDLSLTIHRGERLAIVGKNGAGKSTLTKLICGMEHPFSGTMMFLDHPMDDWTIYERSKHIGLVMQNPNQMIAQQKVSDEVAFGLKLRDMDPQKITEKVEETLKVCGLYPYRNWPIRALSFGQKKRVTIASILVLDPELLILDEPTAGQDYRHYTEIMRFLNELNVRGITLVMITHDMQLMLEYTDRALVLADGQLIGDQAPEELLSNAPLAANANLKTTSLFQLAERMKAPDPLAFVRRFICEERKEQRYGSENAQLY